MEWCFPGLLELGSWLRLLLTSAVFRLPIRSILPYIHAVYCLSTQYNAFLSSIRSLSKSNTYFKQSINFLGSILSYYAVYRLSLLDLSRSLRSLPTIWTVALSSLSNTCAVYQNVKQYSTNLCSSSTNDIGQRHVMPTLLWKLTNLKFPHDCLALEKLRRYNMLSLFIWFGHFYCRLLKYY